MAESKLRELSTDFAVKIIRMCETIKGHYSLVNQSERSATSIGANIREANYARGKYVLSLINKAYFFDTLSHPQGWLSFLLLCLKSMAIS